MSLEWENQARADQESALARGTTQTGVRLYNERLVLSLIRQHEKLPKAEIARLTGLSAQTVSVIVRQLEGEGLLSRRKPQRGKVGQPLVPFELNADGAFSIGLKVGRRSGDLMLLDLKGQVRKTIHKPYRFPSPGTLLRFTKTGVEDLIAELSPQQRSRIAGIGIAAPFELWNWEDEVGATPDVLAAWKDFDLAREIGQLFEWPVQLCNDASAACAAELLFGQGRSLGDFAYFYLGYFIGGGVVLNGNLFLGSRGNAGALASFPVPTAKGADQLIRVASFNVLERMIRDTGGDQDLLWNNPQDWSGIGAPMERWMKDAARGIAIAAVGIVSVLDCTSIVIDGAMPPEARRQLIAAIREALKDVNTQGISPFTLHEGTIGADARAMGAASLPLFDNFIIDRNVLFKEQT